MSQRAFRWGAVTVLMAAVLVAVAWQTYTLGRVDRSIQEALQRRLTVQQLTATWTDAGGVTHTVTTTREEDDTDEEFAQRHANAVEALKAIYPPV